MYPSFVTFANFCLVCPCLGGFTRSRPFSSAPSSFARPSAVAKLVSYFVFDGRAGYGGQVQLGQPVAVVQSSGKGPVGRVVWTSRCVCHLSCASPVVRLARYLLFALRFAGND
jgi:hypothetical protein